MPTQITIATFNCENLFKRYKFSSKLAAEKKDDAVENGFIIDKSIFETILPKERTLTAQVIKATKADIICLQEVENLDTLKSFQSQFLKQYPYQYLIDGNDPRLIDVAVLSKIEANTLRTHQFDKKGNTKIFSRDCLEIEYNINGTVLTIFVNHFKSMLGGREQTNNRRKMQSERVAEIIKSKYGNNPENENFIVLGDLNDAMPSDGLNPLVSQPWLEDVIATRLPKEEQWTHFYDKEKSVAQLDYLLVSKKLADANANAIPQIIRGGLPLNAKQFTGKRFDGIGKVHPSASDHCPIGITINI
jgi:endonuclease/exonuclease/phosphatase family metal-dependent hydrolase